ncbi:nuclear transport factor 2 family protein [Sorangium sp. So ce1099]|uniref:nuclear transport factor 2 family protein n=1 Tax=Sorangium sp. So ce1099 TaxID=3133331 RepID=UPI003F617B40
MKITFIPLVLAGALPACQQSRPDSPEEMKAVILAYFDCVSRKDFARMKTLTTPEFVIFENGKIINNDGLIDIIKASPITKATYSFEDFRVSVDDNSGSLVYFNHGEFVTKDASTLTRDWLESAIFKKVGGEWKLDFVHSTVKK